MVSVPNLHSTHLDRAPVQAPQPAQLLLPDVSFLRLDGIAIEDELVMISITSQQAVACCPNCGQQSRAGRLSAAGVNRTSGPVAPQNHQLVLAARISTAKPTSRLPVAALPLSPGPH